MSHADLRSEHPNPSVLLVSGMHRSGTSALSRLLNLSGAVLPKTLLLPIKGENDKGFWESQTFMEFHDEILDATGSSWNSLPSVAEQWFEGTEADHYAERLTSLMEHEFDAFDIGVVKDPRLSRLIPLWQAALNRMGIRAVHVICVRNPLEIAESLRVRNGYSLTYTINLWFAYLTTLERYTRGENRVFVNYDDVMANPSRVIERINAHFDLNLDADSNDFIAAAEDFLSPDLRHSHADLNDVASSLILPKAAKQLYTWLVDQSAGQLSRLEFDLQSNAPSSDFELLQENLKKTEDAFNKQYAHVRKLHQQVADHQQRVNKQQDRLATLEKQHLDLEQQHLNLQNQHLSLEQTHFALDQERHQLAEQHDSLKIRLRAFEREQPRLIDAAVSIAQADSAQDYTAKLDAVNAELNALKESAANTHAQLSKRLRNSERSHHDQHRIMAWQIGVKTTRAIRQFRASGVGRAILFVKALLTFNVRRYSAFRRNLKAVRQSGLFDESFYLETYPLIRHSIRTPIEHYVGIGEREGRQPNAVFLPYFYAQQYPDCMTKWGSALVHYIKEGAEKGHDPSPNFSTKFYAAANGLNASDALVTYLSTSPMEGENDDPDSKERALIEHSQPASQDGVERSDDGPIKHQIDALLAELGKLSMDEKLASLNFQTVEQPTASIIIPFFNKAEYTVNCLYALNKQTITDIEVILVDDASSEASCSVLESINGITLIRNKSNQGYLRSCNRAAKASSGDYIVQLNNDTLVLEGWLEYLIETLSSQPKIGLVGSLLLSTDGRISEAGGVIFNDASGYNYGRGKSAYEKRFNYCRHVDYCSGASIIIRRQLWNSLGGYDTRYAPAYYEDTDLAMQVREAGYDVVYTPLSKAVHHEGVSSGTDLSSGIKQYQAINKDKFYKKWRHVLEHKPPIPDGERIDAYVRKQRSSSWILWVDSITPTPDKDSGSIDTVNFFQHALNANWGVTFLPWDGVRHEGKYTTALQQMGVECIQDSSISAEHHLHQLNDDYQVVVLSRVTVAKYAYPIIKQRYPNAKIIFNTVDLHFLRYERESALLAQNAKNTMTIRSQAVNKDEELNLVKCCDATIVVSHDEKEILESYAPDTNVHVIPLFREIVGKRNEFKQRANIGFIGGYQHPPNVDAVKFFVNEVWPLVTKKLKGAKFIIAGSHMPEDISTLASSTIEIRGFVPTVTELLEEVKLMVAPLRYGAGIKGKVVSGLCHALPQVVSKEAAEGMGLTHNKDVMIANNAAQFAEYIIRLYQDEPHWQQVSIGAIKLANERYSQVSVSRKITDLLNSVS